MSLVRGGISASVRGTVKAVKCGSLGCGILGFFGGQAGVRKQKAGLYTCTLEMLQVVLEGV